MGSIMCACCMRTEYWKPGVLTVADSRRNTGALEAAFQCPSYSAWEVFSILSLPFDWWEIEPQRGEVTCSTLPSTGSTLGRSRSHQKHNDEDVMFYPRGICLCADMPVCKSGVGSGIRVISNDGETKSYCTVEMEQKIWNGSPLSKALHSLNTKESTNFLFIELTGDFWQYAHWPGFPYNRV